jgi:hypothetical protein
MTTATRARKPRSRPARTMQVGAPTNGCFAVRLTVGKDSASYFVEPLAADFGLAFRLVKFACDRRDGEPDHYDVNLDAAIATCSTCECPGFIRHGWHRGPGGELVSCKHLDALLALAAQGRLAVRQPAAAAC